MWKSCLCKLICNCLIRSTYLITGWQRLPSDGIWWKRDNVLRNRIQLFCMPACWGLLMDHSLQSFCSEWQFTAQNQYLFKQKLSGCIYIHICIHIHLELEPLKGEISFIWLPQKNIVEVFWMEAPYFFYRLIKALHALWTLLPNN